MNIEKLVAECIQRKRIQTNQSSTKRTRQKSASVSSKCCYEPEVPSFQPEIHHLPLQLYKPSHKTQCSKEEILERLLGGGPRTGNSKLLEQKMFEERKLFEEDCTFQPTINPHSKRIMKTECTTEDDPFERLYTDAISKNRMSESMTLNYLNREKENLSFQPNTNYRTHLNAQTMNLKPIHQRIGEIISQKRQNLKKLQEKSQKQTEGKPLISEKTNLILSNKEQFKKNILQRMEGYIQDKKNKQMQLAKQNEAVQLRGCTFKPEINSTSILMGDFNERQSEYLKRLGSKMTSRLIENSFKPEINKISEILVRQSREEETWEDKLERLCSDNTRREKIEEIEREVYQQCTFEPQINLISKCLEAQHITHQCNHTPQEQYFDFTPKINPMSQYIVQLNKNNPAKKQQQTESKTQSLNQVKMEMEYRQMKECTFRPRINSKNKKNHSEAKVNDVKGFDTYCKKIEKINHLKNEKREREEKLFHKEKNYKNRKTTCPIQFKLSQGYGRLAEIKKEANLKFQEQCPFRPQINEFR